VPRPRARSTPSRPVGVAERLLALQRTAGNAAVARLLRAPVGVPLESAPIPVDDASTTTLHLEGIGDIAIDSINIEVRRQPQEPGEKEPKTFVVWTITKRHDEHSDALFRANVGGKEIPTAEVTFQRGETKVVQRLRNAMITNFSVSSSSGETYESFSLEGELVP
jgi:Type VI secretion system effector, Hcp